MPDTTYIVLREADYAPGERAWKVENSSVPAASADAAVRLACKTASNPTGVYVAVPARSWKPVKVAAVQTTALKLESADTRPKETA
jgi:hypothetical protein